MSEQKIEQLRLSCRVCMRRPGVLSVFAGSTIVKWLACTDLRIYVNDGLPDSLCGQCNSILEQAYSFRRKCIKSDEKLRSLLFNDSPLQSVVKREEESESEHKMEMPLVEHVVVKMEIELNSESDTVPQIVEGTSDVANMNFEDISKHIEQSGSFAPDGVDYKFKDERMADLENMKNWPTEVQLTCRFCQQQITGHNEYREHIQKHKNETYKCDVCHKVFWGSEHIERHKKLHAAPKSSHLKDETPCQFCGLMFNMINLKAHIKEKHALEKKPYVKCYICNQVLHSTSLWGHVLRHKNLNLPCTICSKTFKTKIGLRDHERTHSKAKPYLCFHCGKKFKTRSGRNVHTRETHADVKAFKCRRCEQSFSTRPDLTKHLNTEHAQGEDVEDLANIIAHKAFNERPEYKETCETCGKTFKRKSTLWTHVKTHCEEKQYPCSYCGKRFGLSQGLIVHERIHTGAKPYGCPLCDAAYRQPSGVIQHFKTSHKGFNYYEERRRKAGGEGESGALTKESANDVAEVVQTTPKQERPATCKICHAIFATRPMLREHMKSHPVSKPYACTFCDKSFSLLHNRVVHERRHTGYLPYECPLCDKSCAQRSEVISHFRNNHKGRDYDEERRRKEAGAPDVSAEFAGPTSAVEVTLETGPSSLQSLE